MLILANAAVELGLPVTIFAIKGGLEDFLDKRVTFIEPKNYHVRYDKEITEYVVKHKLKDPVIWASHPFELSRLFSISRNLARAGVTCSTCVGVYHPRACFKPEDSILTEFICRLNFRAAEPQQIYFMSESVKASHESRWGGFEKLHEVVPIVLPERSICQSKTIKSGSIRIVSIGRLVPWKAYNASIPKIAKALVDLGLDFVWDVYGNGPLLDELQEELDCWGLDERVKLRGAVAFSDLDMALVDADLFVGMGTSMLEAAIRRIPCIVAVDSSATHCYGMLPDVPVGNIGELQPHAPTIPIQELIARFFDLTESETIELGHQCYQIARLQSSTPDAFVMKLQELPHDQSRKFAKVVSSALSFIYRRFPRPLRILKTYLYQKKNAHG